jgi:hypothetical protein
VIKKWAISSRSSRKPPLGFWESKWNRKKREKPVYFGDERFAERYGFCFDTISIANAKKGPTKG